MPLHHRPLPLCDIFHLAEPASHGLKEAQDSGAPFAFCSAAVSSMTAQHVEHRHVLACRQQSYIIVAVKVMLQPKASCRLSRQQAHSPVLPHVVCR